MSTQDETIQKTLLSILREKKRLFSISIIYQTIHYTQYHKSIYFLCVYITGFLIVLNTYIFTRFLGTVFGLCQTIGAIGLLAANYVVSEGLHGSVSEFVDSLNLRLI